MKHKTSTLEGPLLDAAVAKAEGYGELEGLKVYIDCCWVAELNEHDQYIQDIPFEPSSDWNIGGPIIQREKISVVRDALDAEDRWTAGAKFWIEGGFDEIMEFGPTPLIAAMRAFVASKLGDEVELP